MKSKKKQMPTIFQFSPIPNRPDFLHLENDLTFFFTLS